MTIHTGTVTTFGSISYASQEPWIFSGSVRENIIFGQPFEEKRYWRVLDVCALEHDVIQWKHKDHTLVGERGTILSGLLCNFWFKWLLTSCYFVKTINMNIAKTRLTHCRWTKGKNKFGQSNIQEGRYILIG
jgi:hypothetical protein